MLNRNVERIALPADAEKLLTTLADRYRPVARLERLAQRNSRRSTMSKEAWLQSTTEGRAAYKKAARLGPKLGYDATQDWLTQEFLAYLRQNDLYSPTHGAARVEPPPTWILGDVLAKALEIARPGVERWIADRMAELERGRAEAA